MKCSELLSLSSWLSGTKFNNMHNKQNLLPRRREPNLRGLESICTKIGYPLSMETSFGARVQVLIELTS